LKRPYIEPHLIPHSNITTQNAHNTDNTSVTTGRELSYDIRRHLVESGEGDRRPDKEYDLDERIRHRQWIRHRYYSGLERGRTGER
jgi:hypothetical protein